MVGSGDNTDKCSTWNIFPDWEQAPLAEPSYRAAPGQKTQALPDCSTWNNLDLRRAWRLWGRGEMFHVEHFPELGMAGRNSRKHLGRSGGYRSAQHQDVPRGTFWSGAYPWRSYSRWARARMRWSELGRGVGSVHEKLLPAADWSAGRSAWVVSGASHPEGATSWAAERTACSI